MFRLTDRPIIVQPLSVASAGGFVLFDGRVRNRAGGREVIQLEYVAYPDLAFLEGQKLCQDAIDRFGLCAAEIVHRTGTLDIGETAVMVQVAAPHRREAFAACEYVIDEMKKRLPIWKKEHYRDQASEWVNLQTQTDSEKITRAARFGYGLRPMTAQGRAPQIKKAIPAADPAVGSPPCSPSWP